MYIQHDLVNRIQSEARRRNAAVIPLSVHDEHSATLHEFKRDVFIWAHS